MSYPTAQARYSQLKSNRDPYLRRGRDCARLTIPALLPEEGANGTTTFFTPYQAVGARGVNNLASKMLLALLPPNTSFFKYEISDATLQQMAQQLPEGANGDDMRAQVEDALGSYERTLLTDIEESNVRTSGFEAFKHLIIAGNVLMTLPDKGGARVYRLDKYVVKRAPMGDPVETIVCESVDPRTLAADIQAMLPDEVQQKLHQQDPNIGNVDLYTVWRVHKGRWISYQEIVDKQIPGTQAEYPLDSPPILPLRFIKVDGEDYGRGYVEEYFGDLKSLEGLEKAILFGSAAAAKVLFLVNPNGVTKQKQIAEAESGAVREGNAADVTVLQMNKYGDFRVALEKAQDIQQRMAFAFLLNTAIQRQGERVTAEEIRYMAQELEDALGGIYSLMAQEFQLPLVARAQARLRRQGKLPKLPKGSVKPVIVTGLQALGRGQDLDRLDQFVNGIPAALAQVAAQRIDIGNYLLRRGTALALDTKGLIKSDQQIAQEQQQAQQAAMMHSMVDKGAGPAAKGIADAINKNPALAQAAGAAGAPGGAAGQPAPAQPQQ